MTYSKAQLESMNKTQLVELTNTLSAKVEAAEGKPLTSSELEKRMLDLTEKVISVKSESEQAKRDYDEKVLALNIAKEKELKKLELEFNSSEGKSAVELAELFEELENRSEKAKSDLSYGLKEAEILYKDKLTAINATLEEAKAKAESEISELKEKVETTKTSAKEEIAKIKVDHDRQVEQINYDNKIAIRDNKIEAATKIAKEYGSEIISSAELKELKETTKAEEEEIQSRIDSAVSEAQSKEIAKANSKYKDLESTTSNKIALLENDKTHLNNTVTSQLARIADLEERLKDVPSQIAKAVEAAKSNVSVSQTGSGK